MPQGTLAGPNDFKLLIDDLKSKHDYAKYVDDTAVCSISSDLQDAMLQAEADNLIEWAQQNSMLVNESKTKELHFGKTN